MSFRTKIASTLTLLGAIFVFLPATTFAADKWNVGFNEPFVTQYLLHLGLGCSGTDPDGCPGNMTPRDSAMIRSRILDLAENHVGIFREVISVAQIYPDNAPNRLKEVSDIINIYEDYNLHLIIAFGIPVPYWMGAKNNWFPMPIADDDWSEMKNNLSFAMGDLVKYLKDDPRISEQWMEEKLYIEGFNEFNDLHTCDRCDPSGSTDFSTMERLIDLEGGINWVLNDYGVKVRELLMPSLSAGSGTMANMLYHYYNNLGGQSLPNVHLYYPSAVTAEGIETYVRESMAILSSHIPPKYSGRIMITEVGAPVMNYPYCDEGLSSQEHAKLLKGIAEDKVIADATESIVYWRLMDLPIASNTGCEGTMGAIRYDNSGYKDSGINLINYLKE